MSKSPAPKEILSLKDAFAAPDCLGYDSLKLSTGKVVSLFRFADKTVRGAVGDPSKLTPEETAELLQLANK